MGVLAYIGVWGVAFITARAGVYAIMMGSVPDDQVRHSAGYINEA